LPPWLLEAERTYLLAQALPNRTPEQIEEMDAEVLDHILGVHDVYKAVDVTRTKPVAITNG